MFSESDNLYNLKSKSLRLIVAMDVNLTNLATRKHGSEADFPIIRIFCVGMVQVAMPGIRSGCCVTF